jgi:arginine metabolism regulation protein II
MSQWLVSTAPPKSTHRLLSRIDEEGERAAPFDEVHLSLGPFGVFKVQSGQNETTQIEPLPDRLPHMEESEDSNYSTSPHDIAQTTEFFPLESAMSQWSPDFIQSLLEQPEGSTSPRSPDLFDLIMNQSRSIEAPLPSQDYQLTSILPDSYYNASISPTSLTSAPSSSNKVPQDAVFLLKHYSSTVISLMTTVRHKKTPWHILFIPYARDCLAALALGENLNHASLCAFYGTLSISAFSLGGVSQSQTWLDQGHAYLRQAQYHAKMMLLAAYNTSKPAKYKSILMAILTMVQVSNFCGNRNQAEGYFLEAEKFIRLKGLKRRKSRKVRLLHHCYVFERMFHESIFICGANSAQRQHVRQAVESSGLAPASVDGLSFRLYKWKNLAQEMLRVRDREEVENDLHLERPGHHSTTLYPEIFGIPEPWMLFLSLVIRLGTEKDGVEQNLPGSLT